MQTAQRRLALLQSHLVHHGDGVQPRGVAPALTCGIIGYVSQTDNATKYLVEGLTVMQNRGYDSVGIATLNKSNGHLRVTKFASKGSTSDSLDLLRANIEGHQGDSVGMGHTRWATHGPKTDVNAHPHLDASGRFAVVHNGVIENHNEVKAELEAEGVEFISQTDTEVIAQLIGYLAVQKGYTGLDAIRVALERLHGTWGLCIMDTHEPGQLIAAKNGSPIVIGIGKGQMFVASETAAFNQYTKEFISLEDKEIAIVTSSDHSLPYSRVELAPEEVVRLHPDPWPHWTIREIEEQPAAISRALNYGGRFLSDDSVKLGGMDDAVHTLTTIQHLVITGCGTSLFSAMFGARLMRWLSAFDTVQVVDAAELTPHDYSPSHSGLCAISQSGETKDVMRAVLQAQDGSIPCFSIINRVGSQIARTTRCGAYLNAGMENGVASTKAFTCQATVLTLIAIWFSQQRGTSRAKRQELVEQLHRLPTSCGMVIRALGPEVDVAVQHLNAHAHCFVLGRGLSEPIAREGALKIKEITYLHAEGYAGGALKHGPFALIESGTPIIMLIMDDEHYHFMVTAAEEVRSRGAYVIVITNKRADVGIAKVANVTINVPSAGILSPIIAVIPMQIIAYRLSVLRGYNPDKPRNLAKAVTVD